METKKEFLEKFEKSMTTIYEFKYDEKTKKISPPERDIPDFVEERIKYFADYVEDGLSFLGCLSSILALDVENDKKEFEIGGVWLPPTEEFIRWRDETPLSQLIIASILIY